MSFILDALKKSESERQQQAGAEFADVPSGSGEAPSFKWLWILAVILLVNLVVLLGILLRPDSTSEPAAPVGPAEAVQPEPVQESRNEPTFEDRVAEAKRNQPAVIPASEESAAESTPVVAATKRPAPNPSYLKTLDELRLEGALQVSDLHLDIHVYAEEPAERFVFINMNKHRENSKLAEGPVVKEITTEGVVLEHNGLTFLLPRE
jgi:general secretion pathway protein B